MNPLQIAQEVSNSFDVPNSYKIKIIEMMMNSSSEVQDQNRIMALLNKHQRIDDNPTP